MNTPQPQDTITVATGDKPFRVTFYTGATGEVAVKQLPMRRMRELAAAMEDPASMIKLCTGKDDSWLDSLKPESFEGLAKECDAVNTDFFARWLKLAQERGRTFKHVSDVAGLQVPPLPA